MPVKTVDCPEDTMKTNGYPIQLRVIPLYLCENGYFTAFVKAYLSFPRDEKAAGTSGCGKGTTKVSNPRVVKCVEGTMTCYCIQVL